MAGTNLDQAFYNSCIPHDYPCTVGDKLIDPCNCGKFYLCEHATSIIQQSCSEGTLFNHKSNNCDLDSDVAVIDKLCEIYKPWKRCQEEDDADLADLERRCTGISPTPTPTGAPTPSPPEAQTGDTGAVVGGVIAVLLIITIVVVLFILFKRRGKPMSHYTSYFHSKKPITKSDKDTEETYSEIKDVMGSPVYNASVKSDDGPYLPDRPSFTHSPALKVSQESHKVRGRPNAEEVAYDNPGYDRSADDDDTIQGMTSLSVSQPSRLPPSLKICDEDADRTSTYSDLDKSLVESPTSKQYTPLSVYTRGPNPRAQSEEGGILQVRDSEYEVPRPTPEYFDLQADSSCVS